MSNPRDIYGARLGTRMMMASEIEVPLPSLSPTLTGSISALEELVAEVDSLAAEIGHAINGAAGQELRAESALVSTPTQRIMAVNDRLSGMRVELRRVLEAIR